MSEATLNVLEYSSPLKKEIPARIDRTRKVLVGLTILLFVGTGILTLGIICLCFWSFVSRGYFQPDLTAMLVPSCIASTAIACCWIQYAMVWRRSAAAALATTIIAPLFAIGCVALTILFMAFIMESGGFRREPLACVFVLVSTLSCIAGVFNAIYAIHWRRWLVHG